jgi:hypothetical protein
MITGKEFNEKYPNAEFVKLTNKKDLHNGYQYEEGLNELDDPFNEKPICAKGGLYFCFKKDCGQWVEYGDMKMENIWCVKIPDDAKIVIIDDKIKTNKFVLANKLYIWSSEEFCKLVIQQNGYALEHVKEQTEELCKLAVQQNGYALLFVKEQTKEICKLAVQQNGGALEYVNLSNSSINLPDESDTRSHLVKEQTEEICKLAVQQNGNALRYVTEQTEELCKLAVQQDGYVLQFVKEQTEEICKLAIRQDGGALYHVKAEFKHLF